MAGGIIYAVPAFIVIGLALLAVILFAIGMGAFILDDMLERIGLTIGSLVLAFFITMFFIPSFGAFVIDIIIFIVVLIILTVIIFYILSRIIPNN